MRVIPAIDLKEGQCVRLRQGRAEDVTFYSADPVSVARRWVDEGATLIHIVDLDGAFSGNQRNLESIKAIRRAVDVSLQIGGGIRDIERIDLLISLGIDRVILGTSAITNPQIVKEASDRYPGRVLIGIDAKERKIAIKGWQEVTDIDALDFARKVEDMGAAGIIYTDIVRDGMLIGPNLRTTEEMVKALRIPVIASGGVSSIEDIRKLKNIRGLWGVITGKALYSGRLKLKEAIEIASK
jgi:phosphoribosylformimino-5-aminoimidazole carboxamide ribotide isomerase